MRMCSPEELIQSQRGFVVAPAGCGKTFLIARAVANHTAGRELILTHTHAGVDAIRLHLRTCGAKSSQFTLTTIASWSLLYAVSYPMTSEIMADKPRTQGEWDSVYAGALRLLDDPRIARVPQLSYSGALVDEYQDCTRPQHAVITALANLIPMRVLGDPLQGIFDFGENVPIDWSTDVESVFEALPGLEVPWRWKKGNVELGDWLGRVRQSLDHGQPVDLSDAPTNSVQWIQVEEGQATNTQLDICYRLLREETGPLAAIHNMPKQCQYVAQRLRGNYQCAEAVECPELLQYSAQIENTLGPHRAAAVVEFVCCCIAGLRGKLTHVRRALSEGRAPQPSRYRVNRSLIEAIARVCGSDSIGPVRELVTELLRVPECHGYRWEPLRDFQRGLRGFMLGEAETLADAVWSVRDRSRRIGRSLPRRVVGTTKLLKGLEFDTAVLMDAQSLSRKDLYVALTRASKRLIVLSATPLLNPKN